MLPMCWFAKRRCWRPLVRGCDVKICIVGNSHVGSLKLGWDLIKDQMPEHQIVFFGSPGARMRHLRIKDGTLVTQDPQLEQDMVATSGLGAVIDPKAYDAVVLCGLQMPFPRLRKGISRAVVKTTVHDIVNDKLAFRVAERFRKIMTAPFWMASNPLQGARSDEVEPGSYHPYDALLAEVQQAFPLPGVTFLDQPPETIRPDLRTPMMYSAGSTRLLTAEETAELIAHPANDTSHMNGDFGRLWLLHNLPRITAG